MSAKIKKIFSRIILLILLLGLPVLFIPSKIFATSCGWTVCTRSDVSGGTYSFVGDNYHIQANFANGQSAIFEDPNPTDGHHRYIPPSGLFCDDGKGGARIDIDFHLDSTGTDHNGHINITVKDGGHCALPSPIVFADINGLNSGKAGGDGGGGGGGTSNIGNGCGLCADNPVVKDINTVVNVLAGLVGVAVVGDIILGGIQFSAAGDKAEAVAGAKKRITNGLIALAAFLFIYAFLQWLIPGGVFS